MQASGLVEIVNQNRGTSLGNQIRLADAPLTRLVGLLGKRGLDSGCGLLIKPSSGIHTFGMRFPIDVVALDRNLCVQRTWENLGPFRIAAVNLKTRAVLELPVGVIQESRTRVGDQLTIKS